MGLALTDGFPTIFGFRTDDTTMNIEMWEKRLKPFGIDGGGPNDTTTMRNTRWRTRQGKKLVTLTEMSITVSYDPVVYDSLDSYMQVNQELFLGWPDDTFVYFWGWVDGFEPHEVVEGAQPEADLKICPSNQDDEGIEQPPTYSTSEL